MSAREKIEYDKRSGPVTAHEMLALVILDGLGVLPPNPVSEAQFFATLRALSPELREELAVHLLAESPDEGAGVVEALRAQTH